VLTIAAFDPGGTTGVALVHYSSSAIRVVRSSQEPLITFNPIKWLSTAALDSRWHVDAVVCEQFLGAGPRSKASNDTLKLIGAIEYGSRYFEFKYVAAPPQARMPGMTQARTLAQGAHAVDAMAHAIAYGIRHWDGR